MRKMIIDLIERLILKRYGPLTYGVVSTNHFPKRSYPVEFGYIVQFTGIPTDIRKKLADDMRMILQMIGLKRVDVNMKDEIIEVFGLDPRVYDKSY